MTLITNTVPLFCQNNSDNITKSEEKQLLKRFSQGDRAVFWLLWQKYHNYLYGCCLHWMEGNPLDAEEVLSIATLKAWDNLQKYADKITNFQAWLTRLTHNICVDIHRERQRFLRNYQSLDIMVSEYKQDIISQEETPDLAAMLQDIEIFFEGAINELPPRLRGTLKLYILDDLSYQEIADKLHISNSNARKRISQGRKILWQRFNDEYV